VSLVSLIRSATIALIGAICMDWKECAVTAPGGCFPTRVARANAFPFSQTRHRRAVISTFVPSFATLAPPKAGLVQSATFEILAIQYLGWILCR
jgi:hypothetical protein